MFNFMWFFFGVSFYGNTWYDGNFSFTFGTMMSSLRFSFFLGNFIRILTEKFFKKNKKLQFYFQELGKGLVNLFKADFNEFLLEDWRKTWRNRYLIGKKGQILLNFAQINYLIGNWSRFELKLHRFDENLKSAMFLRALK